jgi:hypothetical protein
MVAVLGPVEALPCYIHTYIHTRSTFFFNPNPLKITLNAVPLYHSLFFRRLPKVGNIKLYECIGVCGGCSTKLRSKGKEVTGGWKELYNSKLHNV